MGFCIKCGREIADDAAFCRYCGASQAPAYSPRRERVYAEQSPRSGSSMAGVAGAVIVVAVLLGGLVFAASVEVFDCPQCDNSPLLRWACSYCGGDGKVTLFQLISYSMRQSLLPFFMICAPVVPHRIGNRQSYL